MVRKVAVVLGLLSVVACGRAPQSPLISTSTQYRLCELDTHCPAAMYCSAGVCDFDCRQDSDCGSGLSCDPRGRCLAPGVAPTPPKVAGQLTASASELALTPGHNQGSFTLQNSGQEPIDRFHVLSSDPAISATPAGGSIPPGGSVTVNVTVDPAFSDVVGSLHVLSTGGKVDFAIDWGSNLSGRLEGSVTVQSPFQLGTAPLAIELGGEPSAMAGAVDGAKSLLWPVNAPTTASDDGTSFTATFTIVGPAGNAANPLFDVPVQRTVTLKGQHEGPAAVAGTYEETVAYGIAGMAPFETAGTFQLHDVGAATGVTPVSQPAFSPLSKGPPLPAPCACTDPGCPSGALAQADWFFGDGFAFEQLTSACGAEGNTCTLADGTQASCSLPADVQCALGGYAALGSADGQAGMVDVWRAQATNAMLQGKGQISTVLQPFGTAPGGTTVDQDIVGLQAALATLTAGLHGPAALLSAASFSQAKPVMFGGTSTRDAVGAQPALTDLGRFTGVVSSTLYGGAELVDRFARSEDEGSATDGGASPQVAAEVALAQGLAVGSLLDLAALGSLFKTSNGTNPVPGLTQSFDLIARSFSDATHGLNAVGYPSDFVPFLYSASNPSADVFMQIYDFVGGNSGTPFSAIANLTGDEAAFTTSATSCEAQLSQLDTYVTGAQSSAADAVTRLCGSGPVDGAAPSDCATNPGGQMEQDWEAAQATVQALKEAQFRQTAASDKIAMLQQQLQEEMGDYTDDLVAVESQGAAAVTQAEASAATAQAASNQAVQVSIVDRAKENENVSNQVLSCVGSLWSGASSVFSGIAGLGGGGGGGGPPLGGCVGLANGLHFTPGVAQQNADQAAVATAQAQAEAAQDGVQTAQDATTTQVTLLLGQEQIQDASMLDQIVQATDDEQAASFEILQQTELFDAAEGKVEGDAAQLEQAMETWSEDEAIAKQKPVDDPTFRLYQDGNGLKLSFDMRLARTWCFLAARAFEYTVNASSTYPGQCLEARGSQDLASALSGMYGDYGTDLIQYGTPQK
ncbi:MAG TPA: hypothetical protein VMB50_21860, partial [Myxococcales bacterium]|nr:hypothetical protein [Myxococcales bacterium]